MVLMVRLMLWCVLCGIGPLPVLAKEAVILVPYLGHYVLELRHNPASNGSVAALKGHLEVRVEQSCEGWSTQQSLGFRMLGEDGSELEHLAHLRSFEDHDGGFTFTARTWDNRRMTEEVAGVVSANSQGGTRIVRYSRPEASQRSLAAATIFPTEHARQVIDAARAGKHMLLHSVFDGSSLKNPVQISTSIGEPKSPRAGAVGALARHTSWSLRLAYFAADAVEPLPEFQTSVELYDNGVVGDMIYDYGEFEVDVILKDVSLLPEAQCP
jgi:hypothetical protein